MEVRKAIDTEVHGKAFFVILGRNKHPWLYPDKYYQSLSSVFTSEMAPDEGMMDYFRLTFSLGGRIECDDQGRVVMPDSLLRRTGTQKDVTLAGVWDHLELFNRDEWDKETERLVANSREIEIKGKEALRAARAQKQ
jgi:DNA-binding transcriptional regulator/RsmH inhibitor MraZ